VVITQQLNNTSLKVSFALRNSNDLIIRAKHIDRGSPVFQLIPNQKFIDDLPATLIDNHTHWLNLHTSEIEIRPAENMWKSSPDNWLMQFAVSGSSTLEKAGSVTLVDIRSQTWNMISKRLCPLEDTRYIMVTYSGASSGTFSSLKIDLPRYGLDFFVDEDGELQSRNMRNMVVDTIQSTGTMLGLINQLVLRPKSQIADEHPRTVIIPDGRISHSTYGNHVRVTIAPKGPRVTYQLYRIDTDLRCLAGNVGLTSKLYQALLHALTSGCLPDPLTGRTGTEEALRLLHSAACRSFMKLRSRDTDLLREISSLSTRRTWYPIHLRKMQTVSWSSLAPLAQHHDFHLVAKSIMDYGKRLSNFSEGSANLQLTFDLPPSTDHLLERASIRASVVYPDQFSLPFPYGNTDGVYIPCEVPDEDAQERAFNAALMVHQWPSNLPVQRDLVGLLTSWGKVQGVCESLSLRYSKDWLQPAFPRIFLSACDRCHSATEKDKFKLMFTLASASYSSTEQQHTLIPTLLAFSTVPEIRNLPRLPEFTSYDFSDGFMPSRARLDNLVNSCKKEYKKNQYSHLAAIPGEGKKARQKRCRSAFDTTCHSQKQLILSRVWDAWPCENLPTFNTLHATCFDLEGLLKKLRPVFRSCWANRCLKEGLDIHQVTLNRFYLPDRPSKPRSRYNPHLNLDDVTSPPSSVDAQYLFDKNPPVIRTLGSSRVSPITQRRDMVSADPGVASSRLQKLINDFCARGSTKFHENYANDLDRSRSILCEERPIASPDPTAYTMEVLLEHHSLHSQRFQDSLATIIDVLSPASVIENALSNAGLWPRVTPNFLFDCMASISGSCLGKAWRMALIRLSQILLQLQRSRRLLVFAANKNWVEFFKELENEGCEAFDPELYPDWLLIQVRYKEINRR